MANNAITFLSLFILKFLLLRIPSNKKSHSKHNYEIIQVKIYNISRVISRTNNLRSK